MDYKEKYEKALELAKSYHDDPNCFKHMEGTLENIFPELVESEDEKIRKEIIDFATKANNGFTSILANNYDFNKWIAWLEKQGKENPLKGTLCDVFDDLKFGLDPSPKQGEQKPIEEGLFDDRVQYASIEAGIKAHAETYSFNTDSLLFEQLNKDQQKLWRKEIEQAVISGGEVGVELANDRRYKQKPEWSEEDEWKIAKICCHLRKVITEEALNTYRDWFKSLRPQTHWKPTEEQMMCLESAIREYQSKGYPAKILESLYEQLKAMRGE